MNPLKFMTLHRIHPLAFSTWTGGRGRILSPASTHEILGACTLLCVDGRARRGFPSSRSAEFRIFGKIFPLFFSSHPIGQFLRSLSLSLSLFLVITVKEASTRANYTPADRVEERSKKRASRKREKERVSRVVLRR